MVVVGGSLAGLRAAEALRAQGHDGPLTIVGAEPHPPYNRPPLSKALLAGSAEPGSLALTTPQPLDCEWLLGTRATRLDLAERALELEGGARLPFDGIVIATGAEARRLPGLPELAGIHVLRTLDDALALRASLERGPRVVVVGGGFIGCEVASTSRARGLEVTVVEAAALPLAPLGATVGAVLADVHRDAGVRLRLGVGVAAIEGSGSVERVRLADGSALPADVVVIGIGVSPATRWLEGSGLELADGIRCDETCTALGPDGVVAAGDVCRWRHPRFGELRVEHWTNAVEGGAAAAAALLAGRRAASRYAPTLSFWSDQHGAKLQSVGMPGLGDEERVVEGSLAERRFVLLRARAGRVCGAIALDMPRGLLAARRLVAEAAALPEAS